MAALRHAQRPCSECPWRRDTSPGKFDTCRYDALRATSGSRGAEAGIGAPLFACHLTAEGKEIACAGWLAVAGYDHLGVRLAVTTGRLDPSALEPGEGWPPLFGSYEEMAATQARREEAVMPDTQPIYPDVSVRLSGTDGNAFSLIGAVSRALRREVGREVADEFAREAMDQESYEDVLRFGHGHRERVMTEGGREWLAQHDTRRETR